MIINKFFINSRSINKICIGVFTVNYRDRVVACRTRCCWRWNSPVGQHCRRFGSRRGGLPTKNGRMYCETARSKDGSWLAVGRAPANTPRVIYCYYNTQGPKRTWIYPHHQEAMTKETIITESLYKNVMMVVRNQQ